MFRVRNLVTRAAGNESPMCKQIIVLFAVALLVGCAARPIPHKGPLAWDGLGHNPNIPVARHPSGASVSTMLKDTDVERERAMATIRPYSEAWWVVHDAIEAENDRRLTAKLIICHSCVTNNLRRDATGSVR